MLNIILPLILAVIPSLSWAESVRSAGGGSIEAGSIDTTKLGTDSVTGVKILNGAVDTNKIASGAVNNNKLNVTAQTPPVGGQFVTGWAANGIATYGTPAGAGDANQAGNNNWTGINGATAGSWTFYSTTTFLGAVGVKPAITGTSIGFQVGVSSLVVLANGNTGIGTTNPSDLLSVKSTFTVADAGDYSAPSQSGAQAAFVTGSNERPGGDWYDIYWTNDSGCSNAECYDHNNTIDITNSSNTFTLRAAGGWLTHCQARFATVPSGATLCQMALYYDGGYHGEDSVVSPAAGSALKVSKMVPTVGNKTLTCRIICNGTGTWTLDPAAAYNWMFTQKIW